VLFVPTPQMIHESSFPRRRESNLRSKNAHLIREKFGSRRRGNDVSADDCAVGTITFKK
jgi:hypothetical protein